MTDLAHWQDDSDNALGGDFDGSLSGLCIMSLSFDLSKNNNNINNHGPTTVATRLCKSPSNNNNKDDRFGWTSRSAPSSCVNTPSSQLADINPNSVDQIRSIASAASYEMIRNHNNNHDNDDGSHCFKKFKSTTSNDQDDVRNDIDNRKKNSEPTKTIDKALVGKNSVKQTTPSAKESITQSITKNCKTKSDQNITLLENNNDDQNNASQQQGRIAVRNSIRLEDAEEDGSSSTSTMSEHHDEDDDDQDDDDDGNEEEEESSRSSPADIRTITPSSISTSSCTSSRSNSPNSDADIIESRSRQRKKNLSKNRIAASNQLDNDNQTGPMNSGAVKDSTTATNVISSSAPMHFKSLYHPFSLKQFPLSPYHQFSNSSFQHDYYDKYHSHDSHQPLQTPLIGFERTQDLLSLKLPPHGPEEFEMTTHSKFPKEWTFDESKSNNNNHKNSSTNDKAKSSLSSSFDNNNPTTNNQNQSNSYNSSTTTNASGQITNNRSNALSRHSTNKDNRPSNRPSPAISPKGFPFNYKSSNSASDVQQREEQIGMDVGQYDEERNDNCYRQDNSQDKRDTIFNQCMRHFNRTSVDQDDDNNHNSAHSPCSIQHQCQESMFGLDSSKLKFQYLLSAPISVATKTSEDTITYLNQAQAYEIKLENVSDIPETKKGFMCSIINIGFHERHMQQIENELWHQWSQQHPDERIFTVDMKLSYNVFGVESDGLNKYEFLWDSSKAAGVFIRINSISTEFTPKKHGGEKGVPFKLSIETFSYNSKTHDSYFVSAAYSQIKVFKPKGAERKFRSDREKISKKQLSEQEKHHKSCDQTSFKECTINSLHPFAESANYYRHSHGHFASKQGITINLSSTAATNNGSGGPSQQQALNQTADEDNIDHQCQLSNQLNSNNSNQHDHSNASVPMSSDRLNNSSDRHRVANDSNDSRHSDQNQQRSHHDHQRDYNNHSTAKFQNSVNPEYMVERLSQTSNPQCRVNLDLHDNNQDNYYSAPSHQLGSSSSSSSAGTNITNSNNNNGISNNNNNLSNVTNTNSDLTDSRLNSQNYLYPHQHHHPNSSNRSFPNINNHHPTSFGMSYYGHSLPGTLTTHMTQPQSYGVTTNSGLPLNHHHAGQNLTSLHPQYNLNNRQGNNGPTSQIRPMSFNHDIKKSYPPSTPSSSSCSSSTMAQNAFKPSSLPNHGLIPPFLNNAINNELTTNNPANTNTTIMSGLQTGMQDASIVQGSNYTTGDNYDTPAAPPCHQAYHANPSLHSQQQTIRQQRSTTTLTTITSQGSSFLSHGTPSHHQLDASIKPNAASTLFENNSNYWVHGANHNPSHISNISSSCNTNQKSVALNSENLPNPCIASQHQTPYDCSTNLYDPDNDHQSIQKSSSLSLNDLNYQSRSKTNQTNIDGNDHHQTEHIRPSIHITVDSNCVEVMAWLRANRFSPFVKTFNNFSGSDLLRLSKTELIEICGLSDGIRLNNCLHNQPIKPRKTLYICQHNNEIFHPIYLYNVNLDELLKELSIAVASSSVVRSQETRPTISKSGARKGNLQDNNNKFNSTSSNTSSRSPDGSESIADHMYRDRQSETISRLLIDGLTSVRIVATEQVVQMLDDESVWNINIHNKAGSIEVCMSSCKTKRYKKQ